MELSKMGIDMKRQLTGQTMYSGSLTVSFDRIIFSYKILVYIYIYVFH